MLWPLVSGIVYLLVSMPVASEFKVHIGDANSGARLSMRIWGMRIFVMNRPLRWPAERKGAGEKAKRIKKSWPMLHAALRTIRWGQTDIHIRIGLGDAAQTAMVAGGIHAALSVLQSAAGRRFPMQVLMNPDFRSSCFALSGCCIFSWVPGDIILAVLLAAVKKTGREGFRWKSIRSKA